MTQVDIAPTLALLFGVPIPKNNVGVLLSGTFGSFAGSLSLSLSLSQLQNKRKEFRKKILKKEIEVDDMSMKSKAA